MQLPNQPISYQNVGKVISLTLTVVWILVPDRLVWVFLYLLVSRNCSCSGTVSRVYSEWFNKEKTSDRLFKLITALYSRRASQCTTCWTLRQMDQEQLSQEQKSEAALGTGSPKLDIWRVEKCGLVWWITIPAKAHRWQSENLIATRMNPQTYNHYNSPGWWR